MIDSSYYRLFHVQFSLGYDKIYESRGPGRILKFTEEQITSYHWELGIDQSTKQTGVFLRSVDGLQENGSCRSKISCMIDIKNKGLPSNSMYVLLLKEFLQNNFGDLKFDRVVMEMPIAQAENQYSAVTLEMLKGVLNTFEYEIVSFSDSEIQTFPPQVWRKHFLADKEYIGRRQKKELVKVATAEEVVKRYCKFRYYLNWAQERSIYIPDSFDAVGILEGGLCEMFYKCNTDIRRVISNGHVPSRLSYESEWVTISKSNDNLEEFVEDYVDYEIVEERGIATFVYDSKVTDTEGICKRVASLTNKIAVVLFVNKKYDNVLKWELDLDKEDDEVYAVIVYRNKLSSRLDKPDRFVGYVELCDIFDEYSEDSDDLDCLCDNED